MYPPIQPFKTHKLKVSSIHTISFKEYGNPNGKPALVVHGGPGGGCDDDMARYFDPKLYRIILVDQRGCGESLPFAELRENSTYELVKDFESIRDTLGIKKWLVFGGSWGSTLSLAYSIQHPEVVTELVLRGIFALRKKEVSWFYQGPGASYIFPEDWEKYVATIPIDERGDIVKAYGRRLRGELGEAEMYKAARSWSIWEGRTSKLEQNPLADEEYGDDKFSLAFARIENHYFENEGFFPRDGFILEKENIDQIRHIPTKVIQGRYDVVCPAVTCHELSKVFPEAEIKYTITGHSGFETAIIKGLVEATDEFKKRRN